jgi:predicted anti-sigma-YlaC factor YlaD
VQMQCEYGMSRLAWLADGERSEVETAGLQAHLESCPVCRAHWQALQGVELALRSAPLAQPSAGFADRVMARVAIVSTAPAARVRVPAPSVARLMLAAAALLGLGLVLLLALFLTVGATWSLDEAGSLAVETMVQAITPAMNLLLLAGGVARGLTATWQAVSLPWTSAVVASPQPLAVAALLLWAWMVGRYQTSAAPVQRAGLDRGVVE